MQDERESELARRAAKAAGSKLIEAVARAEKQGVDVRADVRAIHDSVEQLQAKAER